MFVAFFTKMLVCYVTLERLTDTGTALQQVSRPATYDVRMTRIESAKIGSTLHGELHVYQLIQLEIFNFLSLSLSLYLSLSLSLSLSYTIQKPTWQNILCHIQLLLRLCNAYIIFTKHRSQAVEFLQEEHPFLNWLIRTSA